MAAANAQAPAPQADPSPSPDLASRINRCINGLVDPLPATRLEALKKLQSMVSSVISQGDVHQGVAGSCGGRTPLDTLASANVAVEDVIKPMLRRFSDSSEKCRCLSISIAIQLSETAPQYVAPLLPYIFPVISERFLLQIDQAWSANMQGEVNYKGLLVEPSEEVRLLLVQFLHSLLKQAAELIGPFASDIASILMCATIDKDPDVLLGVFSTLGKFAKVMGNHLKPVAKNLISASLHALHHNRCHVRVAALLAIQRLVLCGAHDSIYDLTAYSDPNIIPIKAFYQPNVKTQYLALLSSDRSVSVREALLETVACWLLELPERKEHEIQLIPYILHGFNDENQQIQELAFELMESIGLQYEKDYEDEIKDVKTYLPEDIDSVDLSAKGLLFPSCIKRRPCLGSRIIVKRSFGILLKALSNDLQGWQQEPKVLAAELLYILIMFVEENATMHLQSLVQTAMKACSDQLVEKKIADCVRLLGFFVDPSSYMEILIPRINGNCDADISIQNSGNGLKILSYLMQGSQVTLLQSHIPEICSLLTNQNLVTSLQPEVHESILSITKVILETFDQSCKDEVIALVWIMLNAYAVGEIRQKSCRERIECFLQSLSHSLNFETVNNLIIAYMDTILNLLPEPQFWSLHSLDAIIFYRLFEEAGLVDDATLVRLLDAAKEYLQSSSNQDTSLYRMVLAMQKFITKAPTVCLHLERRLKEFVETCLIPLLLRCSQTTKFMCAKPVLEMLSQPLGRSVLGSSSLAQIFEGEVSGCHKRNETETEEPCSHLEGLVKSIAQRWRQMELQPSALVP